MEIRKKQDINREEYLYGGTKPNSLLLLKVILKAKTEKASIKNEVTTPREKTQEGHSTQQRKAHK